MNREFQNKLEKNQSIISQKKYKWESKPNKTRYKDFIFSFK